LDFIDLVILGHDNDLQIAFALGWSKKTVVKEQRKPGAFWQVPCRFDL
jgi:hypothetical protein